MKGYLALGAMVTVSLGCLAAPRARRADRAVGQAAAGELAPELVSSAEHWVNSSRRRSLESFRGKVVWVQFNF